jgi:hypothetical protein
LKNIVKYSSILFLATAGSQSDFGIVSLGWSLLQNFLLAASHSTHTVLQSDDEGSELARDNSRFSSVVTVDNDVMEKPKKRYPISSVLTCCMTFKTCCIIWLSVVIRCWREIFFFLKNKMTF